MPRLQTSRLQTGCLQMVMTVAYELCLPVKADSFIDLFRTLPPPVAKYEPQNNLWLKIEGFIFQIQYIVMVNLSTLGVHH